MSSEISTDLIRQVQILLRNQAGIPQYDPEDPSLPSFEDAISGSESSTHNLLCKQCNGKFLRGLSSFICVYCGQEPNLFHENIRFKSTVAYRWLLDSLNLDGSEIVGPSIEENEPNKIRNKQKDEVSVSDLLDLEIKWPEKFEKIDNNLSNIASVQNKPSLNLAGVDLDNFFQESKDNINESKDQFFESNTIQDEKDVNLFENIPSSMETDEHFATWENNSTTDNKTILDQNETIGTSRPVVDSKSNQNTDRFSGWEEEFQSGSTETLQEASSSFDPFVGSTVDLSDHIDTVFGPGNVSKPTTPNDGFTAPEDDIWTNLNSSVSNIAEQSESIPSIDMGQDDHQWQTLSRKAPDNHTINDNDDDDWNDFTSSSKEAQKNIISTKKLQSMDFGSFDNKIGSKEVNVMPFDASNLDRLTDDESSKDEAKNGEDKKGKKTISDLEILMSQMHDLSFMLNKG